METPTNPSDEAQEVSEFQEVARELAAAQEMEVAEFIPDWDAIEASRNEAAASQEVQLAPPGLVEDEGARRSYWQAQSLVELEQSEFSIALEKGDTIRQRRSYYRLAIYHGRTISILRSALNTGREPLSQAAMRNLSTLHRAMMHMHRQAPHHVPQALVLDRTGRVDFARDMIIRTLQESGGPLDLDQLVTRVDEETAMTLAKGTVQRLLKDLVDSGYAEVTSQQTRMYARTSRAYTEMDQNTTGLHTVLGIKIHSHLEKAGISGFNDIIAQPSAFRALFCQITGLSQSTAALFVDLAATILEDKAGQASLWSFTDLIGSPYPRPYQYEAYAVFRGYGYSGQLVEAPTGSGKTMIGMMCIQDWLNDLRTGQSILVLVPTSNYLQQWTGELCYKSIGLRLSPEMVFAGTPNQLERFQKRTGGHPAILLMTYTALSQAGSAIGKGGFDIDSIEIFLQGANVQHVILDEVHKVAENLNGVASDVIRLMMDWLKDGSLLRLIGFTGTAEAYRSRFEKLGLQLVYSIPIDELIAAGYVAPFAELGIPFSYSERELRIRELLDGYKQQASAFMDLVGSERLRAWFADIPLDERVSIGHSLLGMYQGRKDWQPALATRLTEWEKGGSLALTEAKLVSVVQIARSWSDQDLVREAEVNENEYRQLIARIDDLRSQLVKLIYLPITLKRLQMPGFSAQFDVDALRQAYAEAVTQAARTEAVKDSLSTTIVGLYEGLSEWYRRVGEGRVETIKAVIEAERATRDVSGIIIFDNARRINWKQGLAAPGYEGISGLYAQLLGDERFTPYAVLSNEQYLPYDELDPLPPRIATFIEEKLMQDEMAQAMFDLTFQGTDPKSDAYASLSTHWRTLIASYIPRLINVRSARPGEFTRRVLHPMRERIRGLHMGSPGERLLLRLDLRNIHFADLVNTFFDYAMIARTFRQAHVAELEQVSGARQKFFVIPMGSGNRKLLMYDLTSRIMDAESLPINLIIVSSWARTGWNVISPNVLVDATATRDVTAWQQLRGRAIRAKRTWTNDCYRLIMALIGSQMSGLVEQDDLPEDVIEIMEQIEQQPAEIVLDDRLQALLAPLLSAGLSQRIEKEGLLCLSDEERNNLAISLMRHYNKVTHIFELVKAYGSTSQVEYNRPERIWRRRSNIAAKHEFEVAVNLIDGQKSSGDTHAPLIYAADPRADLPEQLQDCLELKIDGCDDRIVSGWLKSTTPG